MTKLVTVITPVYGPSAEYLADAYKSLLDQDLPNGWDWQWVIQQDGETDDVAPHVPDDARISFGRGRHGRAGMARTMGLSRAIGQFVKVLDADDQLPAGTLARDIAILTSRPDVAWTTSRVLDLLPDGSTVGFDQDPPAGPIERGEVLAHWKAHDFRAQVHPATLCIRRDLLLALGGWMALPASEDTGLLLALNAVSRGWFIEETGLLYRKWPGQSTHQAAHSHEIERAARMGVIQARAESLLALDTWRFEAA
ncbi:glycosyltransferase family 2 protein [Streptomyces sp. CBMA123]|uniref:glycosyltransferase family 2 protein n=1 Tax=Streptomyces sp. CBMA123 TaxID=1896313 RepID=UPI001661FC74|nr:glycosyltransferase [Streptomyces sp. CBMA123]MBD0690267.1 glycosyltransferase [Streptomyces sp. CBMA123]